MPRETLLAKRKVIKSCLPINYATNGIIALKNPLLALMFQKENHLLSRINGSFIISQLKSAINNNSRRGGYGFAIYILLVIRKINIRAR